MPVGSTARRSAASLVVLLLSGAGKLAHAQTDLPMQCPALGSFPPGLDQASTDVWHSHLEACQRNTRYLEALGQRLNQQQRYAEAQNHLERALLLEPDLRAARVEYAIALAGVGDLLAAQQLLNSLLDMVDLPQALRSALQQQQQAWAATNSQWDLRTSVTLRLGRDTNITAAPNLQSVTLTVAGQPLQLPLDATYLARHGTYARADLLVQAQQVTAHAGKWELVANLRSMQSPSTPGGVGTTVADAVAEYSHFTAEGARRTTGIQSARAGWWGSASAGLVQAQSGATRQQTLGLAGGWGGVDVAAFGQPCQLRVGVEIQQRQHTSNPVLSGRYTGLATTANCQAVQGLQWQASMRTGTDHARQASRPGSSQHQSSVRLAVWAPVGLLAEAEYTHHRDATAYSPLLEEGAIRTVSRQAWRLQYEHKLPGKSWQALAGYEWVHQRSSLALFGMRSAGPYVAIKSSW